MSFCFHKTNYMWVSRAKRTNDYTLSRRRVAGVIRLSFAGREPVAQRHVMAVDNSSPLSYQLEGQTAINLMATISLSPPA